MKILLSFSFLVLLLLGCSAKEINANVDGIVGGAKDVAQTGVDAVHSTE